MVDAQFGTFQTLKQQAISLQFGGAVSVPMPVNSLATKAAITIIPDTINWVGENWTIGVEWSSEVFNDLEHWQEFSPTVRLTGAKPTKSRVPVAGVGNIRLVVITPDGTADPSAELVVAVS